MINLSQETVALAERLAAAQHLSVEQVVRRALEDMARLAGVLAGPSLTRRRPSVDKMLAVRDEIAAMPLLDPRSPREIMDDLNAL